MISAKLLWVITVLLGGKLQIGAKNSGILTFLRPPSIYEISEYAFKMIIIKRYCVPDNIGWLDFYKHVSHWKFFVLFVECFFNGQSRKNCLFPRKLTNFLTICKVFLCTKRQLFISENFPPDSKISLPTPKFPRSFPFPNFSHNVREDLYNMQMHWSGVI